MKKNDLNKPLLDEKSSINEDYNTIDSNGDDDDDDDGVDNSLIRRKDSLLSNDSYNAILEQQESRYIHINSPPLRGGKKHNQCLICNPDESSENFCSNYISTTKYTLINFIFKNLYEQFTKKANVYFLIIALLSTTDFSPKTPLTTILPLSFVLIVSMIKEGVEDYERYKQDQEINNAVIEIYRENRWMKITWQDLTVGDFVKIYEDQSFPADILLLQSSSLSGMCNIETSNLDGETNLKIRQASSSTYDVEYKEKGGYDYPKHLRGILESSQPSEKMDKSSWTGNLINFNVDNSNSNNKKKIKKDDDEDDTKNNNSFSNDDNILNSNIKKKDNKINGPVPLGMTSMLLRGCQLRNTEWIIGITTFTGVQTKLMLNNKANPFKRSNIDLTVDKALYVIFFIQFCICIFGTIAGGIWLAANGRENWYLPYLYTHELRNIGPYATNFMTYLILVDLLVPISLYVSMELVKFAQAWFIDRDIDMYYEEKDIPAKARTSALNEELGQVEYIFSDKTGTLTRNKMEFLRCTVGGVTYGPGDMLKQHKGKDLPKPVPLAKGMPADDELFRFEDNRLLRRVVEHHSDKVIIDEFITLLAVCNTVIPEFKKSKKVKFQAASPDELALVKAAKSLQYYLCERKACKIKFGDHLIEGQRIKVKILGREVEFDILLNLDFNSTRKRMSVILYDRRDKKLKIYCKGADNIMYERGSKESLDRIWSKTSQQLQDFASIGLRTLVCGVREIPMDEFDQWYPKHKEAMAAMERRDEKIAISAALIEKEFNIIGATAIEDRLQDEVPETIAKLAKAGIKIWVLTGDKVETAINIGRSARLLTNKMRDENLIKIDIDEQLGDSEARKATVRALNDAEDVIAKKREEGPKALDDIAFVISGKGLGFIFPIRKLDNEGREIMPSERQLKREERLQQQLLRICQDVKAVLCCRVSPKQKSQVVLLVKKGTEHLNSVTLSIGDGANDVPMIKAAHVGVGLEGEEGKQAVMSSDYSIGQFRFLTPLLLVHGQWSYRRISLLILYSFYKNVGAALLQICFAFSSAFSGQIIIDAFSGSLYNLVFTALPVMLVAIFNRDVSRKNCIRVPQLYKSGQRNESFNFKELARWLIEGFVHAVIVFIFVMKSYQNSVTPDGRDLDIWMVSLTIYTLLLVVVTIKIAMETRTWIWASHLVIWLSVLSWFIFAMIYSATLISPDMYWVFFRCLASPSFWFLILIVPVVALGPVVIMKFYAARYNPKLINVVQENEGGYGSQIRSQKLEQIDDVKEEHKEEISGYVDFLNDPNKDICHVGQSEYLESQLPKTKGIEIK